jgi:Protein of unknown function (DUF3617)
MQTKTLALVLFGTAAVALAAQKIETLNVKPGLWEMTMTMKTSGTMPLSPELLAKLTPEQRAKMEESMKAHSGTHERTNTYKTCWTKDKTSFDKEEQNCTRTILTSNSNKLAIKVQCSDANQRSNATMEFEAVNPENVRGTSHVVATGGGHSMNLDATYSGKWVGSACGDVQ